MGAGRHRRLRGRRDQHRRGAVPRVGRRDLACWGDPVRQRRGSVVVTSTGTMADGQYEEAQECFQRSLAIFGEYFEGWDIAITVSYLADATHLSGDETEARKNYLDALRIAHRIDSTPLVLMAVVGLAQLEYGLNPDLVTGWLKIILDHPAAFQETKDRARQISLELEKRSSIEQIETFQKKTSDQSLEELVRVLLK